jgi:hypothetical protein
MFFSFKVGLGQGFHFICVLGLSLRCFAFECLDEILEVFVLLDKCVLELFVVGSVGFEDLSVFVNVVLQILAGNLRLVVQLLIAF